MKYYLLFFYEKNENIFKEKKKPSLNGHNMYVITFLKYFLTQNEFLFTFTRINLQFFYLEISIYAHYFCDCFSIIDMISYKLKFKC